MQQDTQTSEAGTLALVGSDQPGFDATFVHVGEDGLRVTTTFALPVGELVRVERAEELALAEVKSCDQSEEGFGVILHVSFATTKSELRTLVASCGSPCAR
ncbi:MAG: hypothetical protein ABI823_10745 [Bryobacteraceae bacterium]